MTPQRSERSEVFRSATILGLMTLASRVLGMVRDVLCASVFGAGMVWDAFTIAFIIPNLFRRLFGEGALGSSFIPVYAETLEKQGEGRAKEFSSGLIGVQGLILGVLAAAGAGVALLIPAIAGGEGDSAAKIGLTCSLTAFMIPYLVLVCTVAFLSALLNARKKFTLSASAPVLLNVLWIAGVVVAIPLGGVAAGAYVMAAFILVGGAAEVGILYVPLLWSGKIGMPKLGFRDPAVGEVARLAVPVAFGLAIFQVNVLVDNLIAELLVPGDGAVSALYYGNRLMQFPLGIIGIAVATAVFPHLAGYGARADFPGLGRVMTQALRDALFLAVPAGAGLMVLSPGIVSLLFGHGAFSESEGALDRTAAVTLLYGLGLPAYCGIQVVTRGFYALKDTGTPLRISIAMVLLNLALNLVLVFPMQEAGLALSTAATSWLNFLLCLFIIGRRLGTRVIAPFLNGMLKPAAASAAMCGAALAVQRLAAAVPIGGKAGTAFAVLSAVLAGAAVFLAASMLLRDQSLLLWGKMLVARRPGRAGTSGAPAQGPVMVSACLLGRKCRWDGGSADSVAARELIAGREAVEICPEVMGGLPVPRPKAVIVGGTGREVVEGRARVVFKDTGEDVTDAFLKGAREAERMAAEKGIKVAYLKGRSPSCGAGTVSIDGEVKEGCGVAAWLLRNAGVECIEL